MARVLIVGCGCRGQALARDLRAAGHAVRGTTRDAGKAAAIAAAGAEPYVGDPDRVATLMEALTGVTIVCWLMGTATGGAEQVAALHDGRLRMLWEKMVDTPVRGVVHEIAGTVPPEVLARGRAVAEAAHDTWRIPLATLDADPADHDVWRAAARDAVAHLLGGGRDKECARMDADELAFTVEVSEEPGGVRVTPRGELDIATQGALREVLVRHAGAGSLVLDLGELRFLDTSGLRLILETAEAARRDGSGFAVLPGNPEIQRLFELAGVAELVPFRDRGR